MSHDSNVGQVVSGFHHVIQGGLDMSTGNFGAAKDDYSSGLTAFGTASGLLKPSKPDLQQPGLPPDPGATRQGALQAQLQQESQLRTSMTAPPTAGLLDSRPVTASRVLLGS